MRWLVVAAFVTGLIGCGSAAPPPPPARAPGPPPSPSRPDLEAATGTRAERFAAAQARLDAGDAAGARAAFRALHAAGYPELDDYVLEGLARAAHQTGDDDTAATAWRELIATQPRSVLVPTAHLELGRLLAKRGDAAGAETALRAARVQGDTDTAIAAELALGELALARGEPRAAAEAFSEARRLAPGTPLANEGKRQLLALRARYPGLAPTGRELESDVRLLLREGDYAAAGQAANAVLAVAPSPAMLRARADAQIGAGDVEGGLASLAELTRRWPQSSEAADAQLRLASLLWNRDRNDEAAAAFRTFVARYPRHPRAPEALYALARIADSAGDPAAAIAAYQRLITAAPAAPQAREARWRIGWIHYRQQRWREASTAFAAAAQGRGPADAPDAHYWRARALERGGQRAAAADGYRALLDAAPSSFYARWAELRLGDAPLTARGVAAPPPPQLGTVPPGTDPYHWVRAGELQRAGMPARARRELRAFERDHETVPAATATLPTAYQAVGGYRDAIRLASARGNTDPSLLYPLAFWPQVSRAAAAHQLDPLLVVALMRQESLFDPAARSHADARGLMQLLPSTAERVARTRGEPSPVARLYDPQVNLTLGTTYLASLLQRYDGDPIRALAAYNGGEAAVERWQTRFGHLPPDEFVESITYRETRDYVKKVLGNHRRYTLLYGR